jgi:hypothetical protein
LSHTAPPLPPCHPPPAPFCPFHRPGLFFLAAAPSERKNQAGNGGREKIMKLEEIKNRTKDAVDYLVQSLESGQSQVLTQYLGAMARFHTYSFGNVMLIARTETGRDQCCRNSRLELAWPLRQARRERHSHSRPDGRPSPVAPERNRDRHRQRQRRRRTQARSATHRFSRRVCVRQIIS